MKELNVTDPCMVRLCVKVRLYSRKSERGRKGAFTYNEIQPDFLLKNISPLFGP